MQVSTAEIVELTEDNADCFWRMIDDFGFQAEREYYERCIERVGLGEISIFIALIDGQGAGFALLNYVPKYPLYKKLDIPEIQDLNVLRSHRRKGIGQQIIEVCEERARSLGKEEMGISVGLDSSFGSAQRLYVRMGYVPDGNGVTYDRKLVATGEFRPIDENLCLMMTKSLLDKKKT